MNQHTAYNNLIGFCLLFDQLILNTFIQIFHTSLGAKVVLKIWWVWHLTMFCLIHILAPLCIFFVAKLEYLEFTGLKARKYPGQENPRRQILIPRREIFTEKEKKIEFTSKPILKKPNIVFINLMPKIENGGSSLTTVDIN